MVNDEVVRRYLQLAEEGDSDAVAKIRQMAENPDHPFYTEAKEVVDRIDRKK